MRKKKIFIGLSNVASQINDYRTGFEQLGYDVLTASEMGSTNVTNQDQSIDILFTNYKAPRFWFKGIRPKSIQKKLQDLTRRDERKAILKRAAKECDIFMFIWTTFEDDHSDLEYLKKLGKKIIVFFVGSDIYWPDAMNHDFQLRGINELPSSLAMLEAIQKDRLGELERRLVYIRKAEKFADLVWTGEGIAQLCLKPFVNASHIIPIQRIKENSVQRKEEPLIVFAPTNDEAKGTKFVLAAIERLKNEGVRFKTDLLKDVPYLEALERYTNADIMVGQLFYPGGGKQQREGLAAGCVVITNMDPRYSDHIPSETPFIHANHETIYEVLKETILNYSLRERLAKLGRPFTEKYYSEKTVCERLLGLLNGTREEKRITPTFLRNHFVPYNEAEKFLLNKWTRYVMLSDWYSKYIEKGTREGLIF